MSFLLSLMFSLQQNRRKGWTGSGGLGVCGGEGGNVAQTMYAHVSKCKNDKRRKKKILYEKP
jgi:hypothetical protein